ncbi:hypothetical protein D3C87_2039730 [compost metagenome]
MDGSPNHAQAKSCANRPMNWLRGPAGSKMPRQTYPTARGDSKTGRKNTERKKLLAVLVSRRAYARLRLTTFWTTIATSP